MIDSLLRLCFIISPGKSDEDDSLSAMYQAVSELPTANRDTLAFLVVHLQRFVTTRYMTRQTTTHSIHFDLLILLLHLKQFSCNQQCKCEISCQNCLCNTSSVSATCINNGKTRRIQWSNIPSFATLQAYCYI